MSSFVFVGIMSSLYLPSFITGVATSGAMEPEGSGAVPFNVHASGRIMEPSMDDDRKEEASIVDAANSSVLVHRCVRLETAFETCFLESIC